MKVHPSQLQGKNFTWGLFGAAASCVLLLFLVALMGHSARLVPHDTVMHTSSSESSATSAPASGPVVQNESFASSSSAEAQRASPVSLAQAASSVSQAQAASPVSQAQAPNDLARNGQTADSIIWVIGEPTVYIIRRDKTVAISGPDGEAPMMISGAK